MAPRKNPIIILAGASASGKTTVAHEILSADPAFELVRSVTTREKRADSFGSEYIYIDKAEFDRLVATGGVLEHTEYAGNFYGTPRSEIDRIHSEGKKPLLILDMNGVRSIVTGVPDISTCAVYLHADINLMEERLYERYIGDTPTADGLARFVSRKEQNIADYIEFGEMSQYFFTVVENASDLKTVADRVTAVFDGFVSGDARDDAAMANSTSAIVASARAKAEPR